MSEYFDNIGDVYQHHSGTMYRVIGFSNIEATDNERFPVMVTYEDVSLGDDNLVFWSRPWVDFIKSSKYNYSDSEYVGE